MKRNGNNKGFTLLEILLVVGIISVLAGIVIVAINPGRQLAQVRNTERKSDIKQIKNSAEQYYIDYNTYPDTVPDTLTEICDTGNLPGPQSDVPCVSAGLVDLSILVPTYLTAIPKDPQGSLSFIPTAYASTYGTGYYIGKENRKVVTSAHQSELSSNIATGDYTCSSFTYSDWTDCSANNQTRTITSSSPSGCTGGSPVLSQSCVVDLCSHSAMDPDCWSADYITSTIWSIPHIDTSADSLTNGAANTAALIPLGSAYYAAVACYELRESGYSDWYLPAKQELFDAFNGGISFQTGYYWSSTEASLHITWILNAFNGSMLSDFMGTKDYVRRVRCLR